MKTPKTIALLMISGLLSFNAFSQITATLNGSPIVADQVIKWNEINSIKLGFNNPKKIPGETTGIVNFYVDLLNTEGQRKDQFLRSVEGYSTVKDYLYNGFKERILYKEGGGAEMYSTVWGDHDLLGTFKDVVDEPECRKLKAVVKITFREKLTYNSYGESIELLEPFTFYFDLWNGGNSILVVDQDAQVNEVTMKECGMVSQYVDLVFDDAQPIFSNKHTTRIDCKLDNGNMIKVFMNHSETTEDRTQDEQIQALVDDFTKAMLMQSNHCNPTVTAKLEDAENEWGPAFGYYTIPGIHSPIEAKINKEFKTVALFTPVTLGSLRGMKFSSMIKDADCNVKPAERTDYGFLSVYFFKHPKKSNEVIMVAISDVEEEPTAADYQKVMGVVEKLLAKLEYK